MAYWQQSTRLPSGLEEVRQRPGLVAGLAANGWLALRPQPLLRRWCSALEQQAARQCELPVLGLPLSWSIHTATSLLRHLLVLFLTTCSSAAV